VTVAITPRGREPAFLWVIQSWRANGWHTEIVPGSARTWTSENAADNGGAPQVVWVSAVDRAGNQSRAARAR
jgi:hypothetical protein